MISGGEEDLANLVLRLAISQMIAERAGQSFSLLILDEVFGSLDEARRLNVVELLRGLQDRFEQVILITHIEPVREGLDRVISVRYDEETRRVGRRRRPDGGERRSTARTSCVAASARRDGLMASARELATAAAARRARIRRALEEIPALNAVFSEAFTERYRRDGMVGVRVPYLNPAVWRYAIEDADGRRDGLARRARRDRRVQHGAPLGRRRLDGSARRAPRVPGQRGGEGDRRARRRVAQAQGAQRDRAGDDAAHDGQHRLLLARSASCPGG